MENFKVRVNCSGQMGKYMWASFRTVRRMGLGRWKSHASVHMKGSGRMDSRMAMG
jgi:hypothetical protein